MEKQTKILCFTDFESGRDVEMLLPLRFFAEKYLNCRFVHSVSFDIHRIYIEKPDIVMLPNSTGSTLYFKLAKYAAEQNIPVFSLVSEGNFSTTGTFNFWGYNTDQIFYQEYVCCWSERVKNYLCQMAPAIKDKFVVTGGVGFDRYSIYEMSYKQKFLIKYNKTQFKKIIGYGAWTFNKINFERGRKDIYAAFGESDQILGWIEKQRVLVKEILSNVVDKNKDILFVFKKHPQDLTPEMIGTAVNELPDTENRENILVFAEEENLFELINYCDIWTCFESTTAIEAWLMNKNTIFINPDPSFLRADIYKGSSLVSCYKSLQWKIDEFYSEGSISDFQNLEKYREEIIKNSIGFADGMNHIRAGFFLKKVINSNLVDRKRKFRFVPIYFLYHIFSKIGSIQGFIWPLNKLSKIQKHHWVFENYFMRNIERLYVNYSLFLEKFHEINTEKINKILNSL